MAIRIVVDTNVFIGALLGPKGPCRELLRRCFEGEYQPLMGNALFCEYEEILGRSEILERCLLNPEDLHVLFDSFMHICEWASIFFLWRPNLKDEKDNHLIELAVAGNAKLLVTRNMKDFRHAELVFPNLNIVTPEQILKGA